MSAPPPAGTALCPLAALDEPGCRRFAIDGFEGFLVRGGGAVRGWVDACPHTGQSLAYPGGGHLTAAGEHILCLRHGALFRLDDGVCIAGPCAGDRLEPWPVTVTEGVVTTT